MLAHVPRNNTTRYDNETFWDSDVGGVLDDYGIDGFWTDKFGAIECLRDF